MTVALEVKNLHTSIGDQPILKGIDLLIKQGEIHALAIPSCAQWIRPTRPDRHRGFLHPDFNTPYQSDPGVRAQRLCLTPDS